MPSTPTLLIILLPMLILILTACSTISGLSAKINPTATLPVASTDTPTPPPAPTATTIPSATETATPEPSPTNTATSTATVNPVQGLLQTLFDEGIIHSMDGEYFSIPDFDQSWAQLYWYQWYYTGFEPQNFVIRVDAAWESASNTANWADSGCGIIFSEEDVDNHHAVFLTMDGYVRTHKLMDNYYYGQQGGYCGPFEIPKDSAEMIVVVENQILTVLVNGEKVVQYEDVYIEQGNLGLSLASGTNKDFGTRCEMTNIDYWEIAP